ncbi:hypothetical protein CJ030_MR8G016826 [Morella rubra]|uniref:DUF4219 domain-containing protein n=1 Tax=Morella rubra TaxID=262757 RepID=A0A6A1UXI3_9ROSI|nr:hypothetical protein CJ030_MR8G016826 [Morella rubra]
MGDALNSKNMKPKEIFTRDHKEMLNGGDGNFVFGGRLTPEDVGDLPRLDVLAVKKSIAREVWKDRLGCERSVFRIKNFKLKRSSSFPARGRSGCGIPEQTSTPKTQIFNMDKGQSLNVPQYFDGSNYAYWKVKMRAFLKSIDERVWTSMAVGWEKPYSTVNEEKIVKEPQQWSASELLNAGWNSKGIKRHFHERFP